MRKKLKWKFYHKKEIKLQKRKVSDTKASEAEKDFVEYYDFNRLLLVSNYQNISKN